jgi:ribokinase
VKAVDTTGTGDAFNAGLITGILNQWDLRKAATFANAIAAIILTHLGAQAGLPTRERVENFSKRKNKKVYLLVGLAFTGL